MPAASAAPHRLVHGPRARPTSPAVRRYAPARPKLADRRADPEPRFAHLRASYD